MPRWKKQHQRVMLLALFIAMLVCIGGELTLPGLVSKTNAAVVTNPEIAKPADDFIDSLCVNTHWGYSNTPYGSNYNAVKQKLVELGIRHVRDSGSSLEIIAKMQDLASVGIKTNYIMNPKTGVTPNSSYWVTAPYYDINDFVKNKVGTNVIDAVEILNEIDVFYNLNGGYYWHWGDTEQLNNNPDSPFYWLYYVRSVTYDTWMALKSDPATAGVNVVGPSLAETYNYATRSPLGDLSAYVDGGNFHPYPIGGNPFSHPFSYNTLTNYYAQGNFPAVNIDEFPFAFEMYWPPFAYKPMLATETGYHTDRTSNGISENVHGKYMPRLFLEYFSKGIVRTCSYEFVDQWNDPNDPQANFGLLRSDLSPKPGYTALKNLSSLLQDPGTSFTPGTLDYALTVYPLPWYDRTQYVHHLLLQKRDGTFYLVLWHEISNGDISSTPVREIVPPDMPVTLTLNQAISSATLYYLDDLGNMYEAGIPISNNTIGLYVQDKAMVLKLTQ